MATVVNVYEAKSHFSELLGRAEAGEDIVIARHGRPIVQLAGRLWIADDFDDPLPDEEAAWFDASIEPA